MTRIETLNANENSCRLCSGWIPKNTLGGMLKCSHCGRFQPFETVYTFIGFEISREGA